MEKEPKPTQPSSEDLKKRLSEEQYRVTQERGTEPPFQNAYWDNKRQGIYVDVVSGEPLFSSNDKFDSGSGWPSFTKPLDDSRVVFHHDDTQGIPRIEVKSTKAQSHLGHVFDDGPLPTRQRFCVNSAALRFVPKESLREQGYGEFESLFEPEPSEHKESNRKAKADSPGSACAPCQNKTRSNLHCQ